MKEKILGALLALSPFKGNSQEAQIPEKDKILPQTEQIQEKPIKNFQSKDKKTANPWKISLETSLPLVNKQEKSNLEESAHESEMLEKQWAIITTANGIFKNSILANGWFKNIEEIASTGGLGIYNSVWENYKLGKISASEAEKQFPLPRLAGKLNFNFSKDESVLDLANQNSLPLKVITLLNMYFGQTEVLNAFKLKGDDFSSGSLFMSKALSSLNGENLSAAGLNQEVKNLSQDLSYEEKLGALAFFSVAITETSNYQKETSAEKNADQALLDEMVVNAVKYLKGDITRPQEVGVCRHLAAVTSAFAKDVLGLNASEVTTDRHVITQIKGPNGEFTLLDAGNFVNNLQGRPLLTKNDIDAALIKSFREPTITDLTVEAGGNKVLYENRHNNFAGLMNNLTNRDNLSLRVPEFIAGSDRLDLFPRLSEGGTMRGAIEKGNIGLQAYWLRNNNEYSSFLSDIKGLNLAGYIPADFSLGKQKFENIFFANLGFYHSVLELAADRGGETKTLDATMSLENYLKCSLNTSLTAGIIAKLADFNLELNRTGNPLTKSERLEYHGSVSPFISFEIPGGDKKTGENSRSYLCSGLEITDYLTLPNLKKLSTIPWFQAGFEYNKQEIDLGLKLRGEFQPKASSRFEFDSFLKKGNNKLELRTFLELYNQEFKKLTPYKDVAGIEAGIRHDLKSGQSLFLMISAKSDGGQVKQILLNLGYKF
ncbi:MAG: hypothetical protein ACYC40_03075 [Patescibacteria group bacterium]